MSYWKRIALVTCAAVASGCCDEKSIPNRTMELSSGSAKVRNEAALSLARCGSAASRAVPMLGSLLYDENVGVQSSAAYALRKIDTEQARRILKDAIERRDRNRRSP